MTPHEDVLDRRGLVVLDPDTCLRRLAEAEVARVAFPVSGDVLIHPVNHGALGRLVLGSVGAARLHHAACPVLVVRADTPPPTG